VAAEAAERSASRRLSQIAPGPSRPSGGSCFGPPLGPAPAPPCLRGDLAVEVAACAGREAAPADDVIRSLAAAFGRDRSVARVVALVATNEPPATAEALRAAGVVVRSEVLPTCDVAWAVEVSSAATGGRGGGVLFMTGFGAERKTVSDLLGTLRSDRGRYQQQRWLMARCGLRRLAYVIEGSQGCEHQVGGSVEVNAKAVATARRGMVAAGLTVVASESLSDTASLLAAHGASLQRLVHAGWAEWLCGPRSYDAWLAATRTLRRSEQRVGPVSAAALRYAGAAKADGVAHVLAATGGTLAGVLRTARARGGGVEGARAALTEALRAYADRTGTSGASTTLPLGVSARMVDDLALAVAHA